MATIIREARYETSAEHQLRFDWNDKSGAGFSFPCNADGAILEETLAMPEAMKNYRMCVEESQKPNSTILARGVETERYRDLVPAAVKCSRCGNEHELSKGDSQCSCGQHYNAFAQELRDDYQNASTYAEYGEDYYGDDY